MTDHLHEQQLPVISLFTLNRKKYLENINTVTGTLSSFTFSRNESSEFRDKSPNHRTPYKFLQDFLTRYSDFHLVTV